MSQLKHTKNLTHIRRALSQSNWFMYPGVYTLVDGQYGSTGKGLAASLLAHMFSGRVHYNVTNNGPNSGHTSYYKDKKIVLKQLPTFGVVERKLINPFLSPSQIVLTNGAIVDDSILDKECQEHNIVPAVCPNVARVNSDNRISDKHTVDGIASTGQGTGPALAAKINRVVTDMPKKPMFGFFNLEWQQCLTFMEVGQGFSLGINSGFYPWVTSRECTVSQGLSDASLPPQSLRKTMMIVRTYPIRVGNAPNGASSGPCYSDQREIQWGDIGEEPELTTVTKRPRRIFTWSDIQFRHALMANAPDIIFVNFCNYLKPGMVHEWVHSNIMVPYTMIFNKSPDLILLGYGPKVEDVTIWQ